MEEVPWICAAVRGSEKHDANHGFNDATKVGLRWHAPLGSPECLLDNDTAEAVGDKEDRPASLVGAAP